MRIVNAIWARLSELCRDVVTAKIATVGRNELLAGRSALVTGGTSGIGYSIARAFLLSGASVVITGRDAVRIDNAVRELAQICGGGNVCKGVVMDNTDVDSFEASFADALSKIREGGGQGVDILVNNAGVNFRGMPNATQHEYDSVMDTNLRGAFFLSQLFGKYMVENGIKGNILFIGSASSLRPADSAYTLSKWGLRALTLGLAKSLAAHGITVNGIAPGPTATPMLKKGGVSDISLPRLPLGRYIMPEEIANMAVFLVSEMGRSVMGDMVFMTGGAGNLTLDDVKYSFQ